MKYLYLILFLVVSSATVFGQSKKKKEAAQMLQNIYTEVLENGTAYDDLYELCKDIGHRLSGSEGAEKAVVWGFKKLESYGFDTVYLQEVMVPHWIRGEKEQAYFIDENGEKQAVNLLALGGLVATNGVLEGELIMFSTFKALEEATEEQIKGKIVFLAAPMNQSLPNTFHAYGESGRYRWSGPSIASKKGAKAFIMRTLSLSENDYPNTGVMSYSDGVDKIPSAALSTNDATRLEKFMKTADKPVRFSLEMHCETLPEVLSYNVIAELKGQHKNPDQIITVGGHLDSWDVGEGAHDDGAGVVHSIEALRTLKTLGYRPNNTLRVVLFMNEENGNRGGLKYAEQAALSGEKHIYAIESDAGGFTPRGFSIQGSKKSVKNIQKLAPLFKPYLIHYLEPGYGGVDIGPLADKFKDITLIGLAPDNQRYFDIHHNENDVFENVNKRELHMGAATIASLIYLLDR